MAENQGESPIKLVKPTKHPKEVEGYTKLGAPEQIARSMVARDILLDRTGARIQTLKAEKARLEADSMIDPLTGAFNRRYFNEQLNDAVAETIRQHEEGIQSEIALAIFDLDKFKDVNDIYGYLTGDQVLKAFVTCMKGMIREEDVFARIGGEEFGLILREAHGLKARELNVTFGRLLKAIRTNVFIDPETREKPVTASVGLASFKGGSSEMVPSTLFRFANEALKKAKAAGRNVAFECEGLNPRTGKPILAQLTPIVQKA